ncbi:hypothetical protein [Streptomyces sp. NPDC047841]|uniref:hypothetical protein n=1 Tax=Streptomyces sp. NPDC047841 TaxID=3154708 RepID=UPI003456C869
MVIVRCRSAGTVGPVPAGGAQRPVTGRVERGVDLDVDGAENVRVLAACRGDVRQHLVVDRAALGALLRDGRPQFFVVRMTTASVTSVRRPACSVHAGQVAVPERALVPIEQAAAQRVQRLATVWGRRGRCVGLGDDETGARVTDAGVVRTDHVPT